jgi:hypothetical protein
MSIMASDAGAFKAATGLFASLDGAWHEVSLGGGGGGAGESPFDAVLSEYQWALRYKFRPTVRYTGGSWSVADYVPAFQSPTFTVVVGVRSEHTARNMIGRFHSSDNAQKCWFFDSTGGPGGGYARAYVFGSSGGALLVNSAPIINGWHLLVLTVDASNLFTFYVDGVSVETPITVAGAVVNATATTPLFIGDRDAGGQSPFQGSFSDILIGPGVMSAADVAALYAAWDRKGT